MITLLNVLELTRGTRDKGFLIRMKPRSMKPAVPIFEKKTCLSQCSSKKWMVHSNCVTWREIKEKTIYLDAKETLGLITAGSHYLPYLLKGKKREQFLEQRGKL